MRGGWLLVAVLACRPAGTGSREPARVEAASAATSVGSTSAATSKATRGGSGDATTGPVLVATEGATPYGWSRWSVRATADDFDADGLKNDEDGCPDEPEDLDGFEDEDGCVDRDNDGDGVFDAHEWVMGHWTNCDYKVENEIGVDCRNVPEDRDGDLDGDGCPDTGCIFDRCGIKVEDVVHFDARGRLGREAAGILDRVARSMLALPDTTVTVEAHVDGARTNSESTSVSERVAAAVVDELVRRGVARERLEPRGLGEWSPVADNRTAKGRAENRRVEFWAPDRACEEARKPRPSPPQTCR